MGTNRETGPDVRPCTVIETWTAAIRCRYLGPTNHRGTRIAVSRFDGAGWGRDPQRITVGWDHAMNPGENYAAAVREYVDRAGWSGEWLVSTCDGGAVAVCRPGSRS